MLAPKLRYSPTAVLWSAVFTPPGSHMAGFVSKKKEKGNAHAAERKKKIQIAPQRCIHF